MQDKMRKLLEQIGMSNNYLENASIEKIVVYILQELNKPINYQISTIEQKKINKKIEEEQNI